MSNNIDIKNAFEFDIDFPANIIYREVLVVDLTNQLLTTFLEKYDVQYCRFLNTMWHPDLPNTNIVLCRIHRWEANKFRAALMDLQETLEGYPYYGQTCEYIRKNIEEFIKEKDNESS